MEVSIVTRVALELPQSWILNNPLMVVLIGMKPLNKTQSF